MSRQKLPQHIRAAVSKYTKLKRAAQDKNNEANREQTQLRNVVKKYWEENGIPVGSYIRFDGYEIKFEATETERIDADQVLARYENGEITREQFLDMISVSKTGAQKAFGGDEVQDMILKDVGKKADIRVKQLPVENVNDEFIEVQRKIKTRIKRRQIGKARNATERAAPRRRVKVRK